MINKKIKILEIFGGIGSATQALKNIGFEVESYLIEIDKRVVSLYNKLHNENFEPQDIKNINGKDINIEFDIAVIGFPCQDISQAGNKKGLIDGTRSSLLWESLRLLNELEYKPKHILFENVKAFNNKKFKDDRERLFQELSSMNYDCGSQMILNAKDFGIPQNRERWFLLVTHGSICQVGCIHNGFQERIEKIPMKPLKEFLEYFPTNNDIWSPVKNFKNFITTERNDGTLTSGSYNRAWKDDKYVGTLNCTNIIKIVSKNYDYVTQPSMIKAIKNNKVKILDSHTHTITTKQIRWNNAGVIKEEIKLTSKNRERESKWILEINPSIQYFMSDGTTRPIGKINKFGTTILPLSKNHTSNVVGVNNTTTLKTQPSKILKEIKLDDCNNQIPIFKIEDKHYLLRYLTTRETGRLMGQKDVHIDLIIDNPKSILYKAFGNAIVVPVLEQIFKALWNIK